MQLAIGILLRDEVLAMEAIEDFSGELFPPVFVEAFSRGNTQVLKSMVPSWSYPTLPLGALMTRKKPGTLDMHLDFVLMQQWMFQAVLDGLYVLLSQKVCSRRLKLQILDTQDVHQNFWRFWTGNQFEACTSEAIQRREKEETGSCTTKAVPLKVQERRRLVQLDCLKLWIKATCFQKITEVLEILNLDSVEEVDVGHYWNLSTLVHFAPYLSQMRKLN
ncbi:PRAME family member 20-like [Octodon degus]|uniref:PRAME family member 20-like n=1 Tax=Octodon degus TaxID=10160 RepID=A0A6P6DKJ4_OCTDE|nr:PRAME family member 20-like [Octodon degus]